MTIECLRFSDHRSGALAGFADFSVPKMGVEMGGFRLFEKSGRRWLSMPSREVDRDGEKKYYDIIRFPEKEMQDRFLKECMSALDKWIVDNGPDEPEFEDSHGGELPF